MMFLIFSAEKPITATMTKEHLEMLRKTRAALVANMDPAGVITELESRNALPEKQIVAEIKTKDTRQEMVEYLLDNISSRPDSAFGALVEALEETHQSHIATVLIGQAGRNPF